MSYSVDMLINELIVNRVLTQANTLRIGKKYQTTLQQRPELLQKILEVTAFLKYPAPTSVRIQTIIQRISEQPVCKQCEGIVKMRTSGIFRNTFPLFCSTKCSASNELTKERRKQTNRLQYGSSNYLTSPQGRQDRSEALLTIYGVSNPMHNDQIKSRKEATCNDKYGSPYPMQNDDIKSKQQQTVKERYGVDNVLCGDSIVRETIARNPKNH